MKGKYPGSWWCGHNDFHASPDKITSGRLVFTSDAAGITILADPSLSELARGSSAHHWPHVWVEQATIKFQYRTFSLLNRLVPGFVPFGEVRLNPSIPWEVEFRSGISDLNADLRALDLRSIDFLGGARWISLQLSRPTKTTYIYLTGGVRNGTIRVPPGVGISVRISGGASNLVFDGRHYAVVDQDTNLENGAFKTAPVRINIGIAGGASDLTIGE
jgi:hypothetical protein